MVVYTLEQFETIGNDFSDLLKHAAGIKSVDDFLAITSWGRDFKPLIEKLRDPARKRTKHEKNDVVTEISESRLVEWGQVFDLFRVPKMSTRMAELLVHAGINSVGELAHRDPVQVWYKIKELDENSYFIVIKSPALSEIESLVFYARLMTRRIKFGYDVPLINFPIMTINWASELQKFRIWTIEDLEANLVIVPSLAGKIGMPREAYKTLLGMCDLCKVNGIDVLIARLFFQAGITSLVQLRSMSKDGVIERLATVMDNPLIKEHPELQMELTRDAISLLVENAMEQNIKTFTEVMA
ncbi:MAG: DUF4332 domain-containing protein [Candidatus Lokiarchaeota archaeon]|nr:DUF4332 domain-containing protein [Candidatus Lokiarchaeota archaeon]